MVTIISLGGSIVAPQTPDTDFLRAFITVIDTYLATPENNKAILIVGGGGPARTWQEAYRAVAAEPDHGDQDWIGIMATRLNAELVRGILGHRCQDPVVTDPGSDFSFTGRVLVAAGWKPGFSTDFDAVLLAERFGARRVLNLSNIAKVYTADPRLDPGAQPLDNISWAEFRTMVGDTWSPGKNTPFDPIASKKAEALGLEVICAAGKDLPNLGNILADRPFIGTRIGN